VTCPAVIRDTHTAALIGRGNKVLLSVVDGLNREHNRPMSILPERGSMEEELRRHKVSYEIIDLRPTSGRIGMTVAVGRFVRQISKHKIALVHANDPFTYRAASLATAITRTPRICHVHHPDQNENSIARAFSRMPERILTPTRYVKEEVSEWLGMAEADIVRVVGNPTNVGWFAPVPNVAALREKWACKWLAGT
jgi:hypothetical protein